MPPGAAAEHQNCAQYTTDRGMFLSCKNHTGRFGPGGDLYDPNYSAANPVVYSGRTVDSGGLGHPIGDVIDGSDAADSLTGNIGPDLFFGFDGPDLLDGGDDPDTLIGDSSLASQAKGASDEGAPDELFGGDAPDELAGAGGADEQHGGSGDDLIGNLDFGDPGGDFGEYGGQVEDTGDDELYGEDGGDIIAGGPGSDLVSGGDGPDSLYGMDGNDTIVPGGDLDTADGGLGTDTVDYSGSTAKVKVSLKKAFAAGLEADFLLGIEDVKATKFDDKVTGDDQPNNLNVGAGADVVKVKDGGKDTVLCGKGDDKVFADNSDVLSKCEEVKKG